MGEVIPINQKRYFSLDEARSLLPVIRRITKDAHVQTKQLSAQLSYVGDGEKRKDLERQLQFCFYRWQNKVRKLGCRAKGMWLVDFDNGQGYLCWVYPEADISYFHGYHEGFHGRVKINN